jgi:hypothetical protein
MIIGLQPGVTNPDRREVIDILTEKKYKPPNSYKQKLDPITTPSPLTIGHLSPMTIMAV